MNSPARARRGVALAIVLLAMVVLGIVIAGVFFGSSQEQKIGGNLIHQERAFAASEDGLARLFGRWDGTSAAELPVGQAIARSYDRPHGLTIRTLIRRIDPVTYWIASEGRSLVGAHDAARRTTGALLRLDIPDLRPLAALAVHLPASDDGAPLIQGTVQITGADGTPEGWSDCAIAGLPVAGLLTSDSVRSQPPDGACPAEGCVTGVPPIRNDPSLGDSSVPSIFDADSWRQLTSRATISLGPGTVLGTPTRPVRPHLLGDRCDHGVPHNWGDPARLTPCARYFPVIHALGDLTVASGSGQGTLLVEGDLTLAGGVSFFGPVVVRGALRMGDGGGRIAGLARVGGRSAASSVLGHGSMLSFSRCAVLSALAPHAAPDLLPRSWIELR